MTDAAQVGPSKASSPGRGGLHNWKKLSAGFHGEQLPKQDVGLKVKTEGENADDNKVDSGQTGEEQEKKESAFYKVGPQLKYYPTKLQGWGNLGWGDRDYQLVIMTNMSLIMGINLKI